MIRTSLGGPATIAVLVVGLAVSLAGCGSHASGGVAGNWSGRRAASTGHYAALTARFADNGQYSSSSTGPDGETAGTYTVTGPGTVTITNQYGRLVYHYRISTAVLTLTTSSRGVAEMCDLSKQ